MVRETSKRSCVVKDLSKRGWHSPQFVRLLKSTTLKPGRGSVLVISSVSLEKSGAFEAPH